MGDIKDGCVGNTLALMRNRGPNAQHVHVDAFGEKNVYLLHSRLSIIDLNPRSDQPFELDGRIVVFNGEIYNYLEIRQNLRAKGIDFITDSDTEVLLRAYLVYGEECVKYFEGMWAFVIYDKIAGKFFCSRDRFGEKPLFYVSMPDGFYFGSETRFIRELSGRSFEVNLKHLSRYLINGYKSLHKTQDTFFKNIVELPSGTNMTFESNLELKLKRYWNPEFTPKDMTLTEAIEGTRHYLYESVRKRLRSDLPVAFCLSGGVDSSAIVSIARKKFNYDVATFSIIDSDPRYDESANIRKTVSDLDCPNMAIELQYDGIRERLHSLVRYHDAPIGTISYLIHSMLSEAIAEEGFHVVCSGTAADELFTGYYDHFNLHLCEMRGRSCYVERLKDWNEHIEPIVRNPFLKDPELYIKNSGFREHIYLNHELFASFLKDGFEEEFMEKKYCESLLRNRMLNELLNEVVPVILHEDDLNSMFYSIENRSPFLDTELVEFAYSIPSEYIIQNGYAKFVLREALADVLNDQVRLDRHKKGFNASISSLLDFKDPDTRSFILDSSPIFELVRREKIEELLKQDFFPNSMSKFIFNFINAKIFLENVIP